MNLNFIVLFVGLLGLSLYFLPFIVALIRRRDNWLQILLLNLFLGWAIVGWVIALVWAAGKNPTKSS